MRQPMHRPIPEMNAIVWKKIPEMTKCKLCNGTHDVRECTEIPPEDYRRSIRYWFRPNGSEYTDRERGEISEEWLRYYPSIENQSYQPTPIRYYPPPQVMIEASSQL
jgi:hypothetical protein